MSFVGLAGLATAHALALSGHRVRVFEQPADSVLPYSSAFRLPPNGTKIMEQWGVLDELIECGTKLTGSKFIDREWTLSIGPSFARGSSELGVAVESGNSLGSLQWPDKVCRELGAQAYSVFVRLFHSFSNYNLSLLLRAE